MRIPGLIIAAPLLLTGCVSTPAGLYDRPAVYSMTSTRSAHDWATCLADNLPDAQLRSEGDHYWVTRANNFGVFMRYDFFPTSAGSRGEFRHTSSLTVAGDAFRKCASG